jgi:hypothetical protein
MPLVTRRFDRIAYYARNFWRDISPQIFFRARLKGILATCDRYDRDHVSARLNYCNKLAVGIEVEGDVATIDRISMKNSFYYYDLKEHARYFPRSLKLSYQFGDVVHVPQRPTIVKSRPIGGKNQNSVLMKLDKLRHFYFWPDPTPFAEKKPMAVWRGDIKLNPKRRALVRRWHGRPGFDIGHAGGRGAAEQPGLDSPFLLPVEQAAFKYIVSVEGNDVASNLKWVMATNSLCLMPAPAYETWFMEGRLEAGKHYVPLRPDFADLEDKISHYERHADDALAIIANAHAYVRQFQDEKQERLISLLVLYKYFVATGQIEPDGRIAELFVA